MICEQHTTTSIFNWLAWWLSNNLPPPKETVCDQSLALMSAITQCFTQYSSLEHYLVVSAELTMGKLSPNSHLVRKWEPLKKTSKKVKEVLTQNIGIMVKSQLLNDIYSTFYSIFVVIINETDENNKITGLKTPCA